MVGINLLYDSFGDGQSVQVHELRQLMQLFDILDLLTKLCTETSKFGDK
jgi:hypothetical protein